MDSFARPLISDVEEGRTSADTGVEAAVGVAKERKPANGRVPEAGGDA